LEFRDESTAHAAIEYPTVYYFYFQNWKEVIVVEHWKIELAITRSPP
jgi:hypothetical protein